MDVKIEYDGWSAKLLHLDEKHIPYISQELTYYDQAKAFTAERSGNPHINPYTRLFNLKNHSFPTGLLPRVCEILNLLKVSYKIHKNVATIEPVPWKIPDEAYPHQIEIVKTSLEYKRCLIQSPTGSGKTFAAAFFLGHFPYYKCLFIVPTKTLMYQTVKVLEQLLGEPIGMYGDGKKNWERITVGIVNSLSVAAKNKCENLKGIQVLVIDEAHRAGSSMYKDVSRFCTNTDYRLAVSATVKMRNNNDLVLEGHSGPLALKVPPDVLVSLGVIFKPNYLVVPFHHDPKQLFTGYKCDAFGNPLKDDFGRVTYRTVDGRPSVIDVQQEGIGNNKARNELIIDILNDFLHSKIRKGTCLILVEYKQHAQNLIDIAKQKYDLDLPFCSGKNTGRQVEEMVGKLSTGEYPAMIATRVLNEGKDIKPIELVIIASGGAGGTRTIQQVGRGVRTSPDTGKVRCLIVDFSDENAAYYLSSQAQKRFKTINEEYKNCVQFVSRTELKSLL